MNRAICSFLINITDGFLALSSVKLYLTWQITKTSRYFESLKSKSKFTFGDFFLENGSFILAKSKFTLGFEAFEITARFCNLSSKI